jgi:hypothetical protein
MVSKLVIKVAESLNKQGFALVRGSDLRKELFRATDVLPCSAQLHPLWNFCASQRDEMDNLVYPFKRSMVSYFNSHSQRTSGKTTSIEYIDDSTVHCVSNYRVHRAWPTEADDIPGLVAMRSFVFNILSQVSTDDSIPFDKFEAMQTAFRVTYDIKQDEDGDPGPEGIHQDDAVLTVVTLIGRDNVKGGVNRVWHLDQRNGKPSVEDLSSNRLLVEQVLLEPFDTLLVMDREVKHEATSISPEDPNLPAVRDVLTYELREQRLRHDGE